MATTMTSCSPAILVAKSIQQSLHSIDVFTSPFARKFYEQMVVFIPSRTLDFTKNKLLKLVSSMKADFIFAGLNLNIIIQKR